MLAGGVGDATQVTATATVSGRALRPPPPVHVAANRLADGTIRIVWVRRSRVGWAWLDGSDAPLGEEAERYRLTLTCEGGAPRTVETDAASYDYLPVDQVADDAAGATAIAIAVVQLGSIAASDPPASGHFAL